jgi:hypothetical protein
MSNKCSLINESNYATYDAKYKSNGGSCMNNRKYNGGNNCTEQEFACYANYNLTKKRTQLDSNLEEIYQPQNGRFATFDSNYQTTMLTGVIWAMLGTTVLYYAFTKI